MAISFSQHGNTYYPDRVKAAIGTRRWRTPKGAFPFLKATYQRTNKEEERKMFCS
jgi:hypothetical protein